MDRPRTELRQHMLRPNLSLNTVRQTKADEWRHALVADAPTSAIFLEVKDGSNVFPLYLYPKSTTASAMLEIQEDAEARPAFVQKVSNINRAFIEDATSRFGFSFIEGGAGDLAATIGPEDLFNYIYAILHSPTYRGRYVQYLKTDFPRIPLTRDRDLFGALCTKGAELVSLHLLKSPGVKKSIAHYPIPGSDTVETGHPRFIAPGMPDPATGSAMKEGRVYINKDDPSNGR
jgi:predicted helicase